MKTNKNKPKPLPKLKAILANPYKIKCPTLEENELNELRGIIEKAIAESGNEPKKFATSKHLNLGLQSTLRAVNNRTCSCLMISLSIKPNHIISLIARNAQIKDQTMPVYVQPKLEDFAQHLFGIKSLAITLPLDLKAISEDLYNWLEIRKHTKINLTENRNMLHINTLNQTKIKKKIKQKTASKKHVEKSNNQPANIEVLDTTRTESMSTTSKNDTEDFISLVNYPEDSNKGHTFTDDKIELEALLNNMTKCKQYELASELKSKKNSENTEVVQSTEISVARTEEKLAYQPLIVHKILPNPNRISKIKKSAKKRKANGIS